MYYTDHLPLRTTVHISLGGLYGQVRLHRNYMLVTIDTWDDDDLQVVEIVEKGVIRVQSVGAVSVCV